MNASYAKSPLVRQAEKLLYEDSLPPSDSSMDFHRSLSPSYRNKKPSKKRTDNPYKTRSDARKLDQTSTSRHSTSKTFRSHGRHSKLDISRSKTTERKSSLDTTRYDEQLSKPSSCQQEKNLLRIKIGDLQKGLEKQDEKVKKLYKRVLEKRGEVKGLTDQLVESKKKNLIVLELKEKVRALENNEISLVQELQEQQRVARNTLEKLHELQEDWTKEIERTKRQYQEFSNKKLEDQQNLFESKIRYLEEDNWRLKGKIREMETMEDIERTRLNIQANSELVALKSQLNEKTLENERLKGEIQDVKQAFINAEKEASFEIRSLKNSLDALNQQNKNLKVNEEELEKREIQERNNTRRKIETLQEELEQKERMMKERDLEYKEQLEKITRKVSSLQGELRKLTEYEEKVDELGKSLSIKDNELELTKKYYKEKLESKKVLQEQQKKEWTNIYNELLSEIKNLKGEIDSLVGENKRLMTSVRSKIREY